MSATRTLPKATIKRSGEGFTLTVFWNNGYEEVKVFDTFSEARAEYDNSMGEYLEAMWEIESERAAERAADRYWEEGPTSFRLMRQAEQEYEDQMTGYLG